MNKETKQNQKGFTLIELLAVVIILGVLMIIAIPSVTTYIQNSRKNAYIDTAKEVIGGARNLVNEGKLGMYDTNTTYYIPSECIQTENSSQSPYGKFTQAYVGVIYNGQGYSYYWISVDDAGQGIPKITALDKLDIDSIQGDLKDSDIEDVISATGVGEREEIKILNCTTNSWDRQYHLDDTSNNVSEDGSPSAVIYPEGKNKATVEVGDVITIGTEQFNVVKHSDNDLILLARYNLKVGKIYQFANSRFNLIGEYTSSDPGYGKQSSDIIGMNTNSGNIYNGTVKFSDSNYWTYTDSYINVYDSNSNLYPYVEEYKSYLESLGAKIKEARLLYYSEALELGCTPNNTTCYNGQSFLKGSSFWLGTAGGSDTVWDIHSFGPFNRNYSHYEHAFGVRPVIVI